MLYRLIPEEVIPAKNYIFTGAKNVCVGDIQIDDLVSIDEHLYLRMKSRGVKSIALSLICDNNYKPVAFVGGMNFSDKEINLSELNKCAIVNKKIYRALNSLLFCIDATLIYFCVFRLINNGIVNYYVIIITLISSIFVYKRKFTQKMSK